MLPLLSRSSSKDKRAAEESERASERANEQVNDKKNNDNDDDHVRNEEVIPESNPG